MTHPRNLGCFEQKNRNWGRYNAFRIQLKRPPSLRQRRKERDGIESNAFNEERGETNKGEVFDGGKESYNSSTQSPASLRG
jgi:hypothetical protein